MAEDKKIILVHGKSVCALDTERYKIYLQRLTKADVRYLAEPGPEDEYEVTKVMAGGQAVESLGEYRQGIPVSAIAPRLAETALALRRNNLDTGKVEPLCSLRDPWPAPAPAAATEPAS